MRRKWIYERPEINGANLSQERWAMMMMVMMAETMICDSTDGAHYYLIVLFFVFCFLLSGKLENESRKTCWARGVGGRNGLERQRADNSWEP